MSRNFSSDNTAHISPAILASIHAANIDTAPSYGGDALTQQLTRRASALFEREVAIFPVSSGTAANSLALAQFAHGGDAVYCYEAAHIATDECGAPEFFSGGAKLIGLPAVDGRIGAAQLAHAIQSANELGVHHVRPAAVSITQSSEWGTVYALQDIAAIAAVAHQSGLHLHMDGARFANAVVHLGCTPAQATWRAGVDVLSFGATKNGAMCAEAVVFFEPALAADFERRRKRAGHLLSKMRFVSAQLLAYITDDLWLSNARQANAMAARLGDALAAVAGVRLVHPVDANELFVAMPENIVAALEQAGFGFYRWPSCARENETAIRLVTSFSTRTQDVDAFLDALR